MILYIRTDALHCQSILQEALHLYTMISESVTRDHLRAVPERSPDCTAISRVPTLLLHLMAAVIPGCASSNASMAASITFFSTGLPQYVNVSSTFSSATQDMPGTIIAIVSAAPKNPFTCFLIEPSFSVFLTLSVVISNFLFDAIHILDNLTAFFYSNIV